MATYATCDSMDTLDIYNHYRADAKKKKMIKRKQGDYIQIDYHSGKRGKYNACRERA